MNPLLSMAGLNDLISFKSAGLPFNPGIFRNDQPKARQQIIDVLKGLYDQGLGFTLTGGYGGGHVSPEHTKYGTAVDLVPTGETTYDQLVKALSGSGMESLVHDAGSGKHIHAHPSKDFISKYDKGVDKMNNMGYLGALPKLSQKDFLPNIPQPAMHPSLPQLSQSPTLSNQPLLSQPFNSGIKQNSFLPEDKGFDTTRIGLALMAAGQGLGSMGGYNFNMTPVMQYKMQQKEKQSKAEKDAQSAAQLTQMYQQMGYEIPDGISDPKQVQEFAKLNASIAQSKNTQDYQNKLLMFREKELQHKIKGETGANLTGKSSDAVLQMLSLKNNPEMWGSLSPDVQAQMDEYLDLKIKDAGKVFTAKQAETAGGEAGKLPYARPLAREKEIGANLLEESLTGELKPIEGSPEAIKRQEALSKKKAGLTSKVQMAKTVIQDADRALDIVEKHPFQSTGFGGLTAGIPATKAKALQGHIDSVKANIGIDELLNIKASGAGLGQVPQAQLNMLASVLGNLDITQSADVLEYNLNRVKIIYKDLVEKYGDQIDEARQLYTGESKNNQESSTLDAQEIWDSL